MIAYGGKFLILIREIKIPPTHICVIMLLHVVLVVEIYKALQAMWFVYEICGLITWYVSCCAKCHFPPFLPFSSITMPRYWKMLPVSKTPENNTLRAIFRFCNNFVTILARLWAILRKIGSITTIKSNDI